MGSRFHLWPSVTYIGHYLDRRHGDPDEIVQIAVSVERCLLTGALHVGDAIAVCGKPLEPSIIGTISGLWSPCLALSQDGESRLSVN